MGNNLEVIIHNFVYFMYNIYERHVDMVNFMWTFAKVKSQSVNHQSIILNDTRRMESRRNVVMCSSSSLMALNVWLIVFLWIKIVKHTHVKSHKTNKRVTKQHLSFVYTF